MDAHTMIREDAYKLVCDAVAHHLVAEDTNVEDGAEEWDQVTELQERRDWALVKLGHLLPEEDLDRACERSDILERV